MENSPNFNPGYLKYSDDNSHVFSSFKNDLPDIESKVMTELLNFTDERATFAKISNGSVIQTRLGANNIYSIFFDMEYGSLLKLITEVNSAGELVNLFVIRINPTQDFRNDFFSGTKDIEHFRGDIDFYTVGDYFDSVSGNNPQTELCWKIVFGSSSTPGGGNVNLPDNPSVGTIVPGVGGVDLFNDLSGCIVLTQRVCGCSPHHVGGNSNPSCNCTDDDIYVTYLNCIEPLQGDNSNTDNQISDNSNSSKLLSISYWECVNLLDNIGLLNDADLFRTRLKNCEGYDAPYDVDAQSGGDGSTTHPDFDFCEKWITYRDNCLSTSTITEEYNTQIAIWANFMADHRNLFDAVIGNTGNCVDTDMMSEVVELQNKLSLDDDEAIWLLVNENQFQKVSVFLQNHSLGDESEKNLSLSIAKAYIGISSQDGEIILDLGDVGDPTDVLWGIMKEMMLDMIKELVIDFIPGGTLATMEPELFDNLQEGEWMDAMYTAADIVINEADAFFPAVKVISFASGMIISGKQLKKVFKAFNKAKALGQEFLLKLYNVFRNKLNWGVSEIRKNFQWLDINAGAKLKGVTSSTFFNKLKEEFEIIDIDGIFLDNNDNPVFKIATIEQANLSIFMCLYSNSNSGYAWTIAFYTGPENANNFSDIAQKFKIRFDQ